MTSRTSSTGTADLWPAPHASAPVVATVPLPGSKSLTNRELVLAAIADGPGVVRGALRSRDTELMAASLTALGSRVDTAGEDWAVEPGIDRSGTDAVEVDCGLAGTVMRFVPPLAALRGGRTRFDGDPHARTRPMSAVLGALADLGADVRSDTGTLPFEVHGTGTVRGGRIDIDASASSQFVSALLLAAPAFDDGLDLFHVGPAVPSMPHIDMTVACLRERGVEVETVGADHWRVLPGPVAAREVTIEPDLSNAAPFLILAMTSGGSVTIPRWPEHTTQPGGLLAAILGRMGAEVTWDAAAGLTVTGTGAIHGLDEADLRDAGELVPALAALAALADSPTTFTGIQHIRGHETDRLSALAAELGGLGADVTEHEDGLTLRPATLHGGVFHTYADHRMAHAGAILGSAVDGVLVEDVATTSKTFPGFEHVWAGLFG